MLYRLSLLSIALLHLSVSVTLGCSLDCQNGSKCISDDDGDDDGRFSKDFPPMELCQCAPPYWGKYCEQSSKCEIDCLNGGYCANSPGERDGQWCTCPGYEGRHCQFKPPTKEDCKAAITCENGGECCSINVEPCIFGDQDPYFVPDVKYYCNCPIGFSGERCEQIVENICDQYCLNGGHCELEIMLGLNKTSGPGWCGATSPGGCTDVSCMYPSPWYEKRCVCPETSQGQFCEELNTCGCKNNGYCMDREQSHLGTCLVECMFNKKDEGQEQCFEKCEERASTTTGDDDIYGSDDHIEYDCSCNYMSFGDKCKYAVTTVCPNNDKAKEMHESCMGGYGCDYDTMTKYFGKRYCANGGGCNDVNGMFPCDCSTGFNGFHCENDLFVVEQKETVNAAATAKALSVVEIAWVGSVTFLVVALVVIFYRKSNNAQEHELILEMGPSELDLDVHDTEESFATPRVLLPAAS